MSKAIFKSASKKPVVFFHMPDADGWCSGAIVQRFLGEVELIPVNYGLDFPWGKVKGREVHMVDFGLQPFSDMVRLEKEAESLTWVDHHQTAIDAHDEHVKENPEFKIEGLRRVGDAACELCWEYYAGPTSEELPEAVYLLGRYDVFDLDADPDVVPFQYGVRLHDLRPTGAEALALWKEFFEGRSLESEIENGKVILQYLERGNESLVKSAAFETEHGGIKFLAINGLHKGSMQFDSMWDENKYDATMIFGYRDGSWTASFYTVKEGVDVSVIAKEYGGGGHKGAAGCQWAWGELPDWVVQPGLAWAGEPVE